MCGIIGYIGKKNAVPILINGLKKLEYRGYDSSGIAIYKNNSLSIHKSKGKLKNLENKIERKTLYSHLGIGHTRWATHGEPSDVNSHPHTNTKETIAVIHNGIIENYLEIKNFLIKNSKCVFKSETDTEIIAHLIDYFYKGNLFDAVYKATQKMEGSYAIGVICKYEPNKLIGVRKDSPLIIGIGENENFIASDIPAILKYTKDVLLIENNQFAEITEDEIKVFDNNKNEIKPKFFKVTWDEECAEKEGFDHFTLKEIFEQPKAVHRTLYHNIKDNKINFENINITREELKSFNKIYILGCGTAYNAGLIGKYALKKFAGINAMCEIASEFRYNDPIIDKNTLVICISQSGETLDTLQSLRLAKENGAKILSIVNIVGSSITRESDHIFYTLGGPEIGVASTKIFTCQLMGLYLLSLHFGNLLGKLNDDEVKSYINELISIPDKIQKLLDDSEKIKQIASEQFQNESIFYMGRNVDMEIAYESSLKLKEISYINSFAIGAGELKHGTIALVKNGTFVISFTTQEFLFDKMISNIKEIKARGAYILTIVKDGCKDISDLCDKVFKIPYTLDIFTPILSIIPMQILAYYISVMKGNDVDKPRNLAKSVTVE